MNVPSKALQKQIRARDLVYVSDTEPGIRRYKRGRSFIYHRANRLIKSQREIERIQRLAIPPAYVDVWICTDPRGHLQATGRDARGRKQYRYHPDWRSLRDNGKFKHLIAFGRALPSIRRRVAKDLRMPGLPRDKVLAAVVSLLDKTLIRVGNETYARDNGSYGVTTLRSRHLKNERGRLRFVFRGKSGKERDIELDDKRLVKIIRRVHKLPGQKLFQYLDDDGQRQPVDSAMVNAYLRDAAGSHTHESFSAKDFRTWGATLYAARLLAREALPSRGGERARKKVLTEVVASVAAELGNTPAVCRASYIDPQILAGWLDGALHCCAMENKRGSALERCLLNYLDKRRRQLTE